MRQKSVLIFSTFILLSLLACTSLAQWVHTGPQGGSVNAFTTIGSSIFAATSGGGVFRTSDSGTSWMTANAGLVDTNVRALTVFGSALFAATDSTGIFRSTDGALHWISANAGLPKNTAVNQLSPLGNALFAGTNGAGIFVTTDNGNRWSSVNQGLADLYVRNLHPNGTDLFAECGNHIYRTTDSGATWVNVSQGLPASISEFAVRGSYLFVSSQGVLFRSINSGRNWSQDTVKSDDPFVWRYSGKPSAGVLSLLDLGSVVLAGTGIGVFRSQDSGSTWSISNSGMYVFGLKLGKDVVLLTTIGSSILARTSDSLLYRTTDNGVLWEPYTALGNNKVNAFATSENGVFAGTDTGGILRSTDFGASWTALEGMTNASPITSLTVAGMNVFAGTVSGGVFRTTNDGLTWTPTNSGLTGMESKLVAASGTYVFALIASQNSNVQDIFRSTNLGVSWKSMGFETEYTPLSGLAANSKYVFISRGPLYRSPIDTADWKDLFSSLGSYSDGALDISDSDIFSACYPGLFHSTDNGSHWDSAGLAHYQINALCRANGFLFAGAPDGVWRRPLSDFPVGSPALVLSTIVRHDAVACYPNPSSGIVTIQCVAGNITHITVTNVLGQSLIELSNPSSSSFTLDLSKLPAGTYFARIVSQDHVTTKLIVKE